MANPYKAEIEAEIGGITRRLRLRANELVELQTHLGGKGLLALAKDMAADYHAQKNGDASHTQRFDYAEAAAVVHFALRGCGATHDFKKTLAFLDDKPPNDVITIAQRVVVAAFGNEIAPDGGGDEGNAAAPGANRSTTSPGAT